MKNPLKGAAVGHEEILAALATGLDVVEIGFLRGHSARAMLPTCRSYTAVDIAPDAAALAKVQSEWPAKFASVIGDSMKLTPIACGFLFIDGCHDYPFVKSDLTHWGRYAGKYIALHDSARPQASGVRTAAFEWLAKNHHWHVLRDIQENEGLLVLERRQ